MLFKKVTLLSGFSRMRMWVMQEEKAERERLARERKVQAKAKVKGKVCSVFCPLPASDC